MGLQTFLKAASQLFVHAVSGNSSLLVGLPRTEYEYARDIGLGLSSSVVMGVVQWGMRSFPEAPLVVQQRHGEDWEIEADHPLQQLIAQPNPFYSGEHLWMSTYWSWCVFGNAYWRVVRERTQQPRELWWIPPWSIEPQAPTDGTKFLTHYRYQPDGRSVDLKPDQVVHFRHGIDPRNQRLGLPPLLSVIREIWSDDEASNWVAALLRNMGIPGMVITPEGEALPSVDEVERIKAYVRSRFTGDHRGEPMVLGAPTKVQPLGWNPREMDLSVVRDVAEERVSACLGIPAAVVGFGTGLQQTKVGATMGELRHLAWQNGIVPVQRIMAGEVGRVLLPSFGRQAQDRQVAWDYRRVQALQEDETTKASRYDLMVKGGWVKISEARRAMGLDTEPADDVYLRPISVTEVRPGEAPSVPTNLLPFGRQRALPEGEDDDEDDDEAEEGKAQLKQGTVGELINGLIGRHAPRLDSPPRSVLRLGAQLLKQQAVAERRAEALLLAPLRRLGDAAATAAREVLAPKQDLTDLVSSSVIQERIPFVSIQADLTAIYEQVFDLIAGSTIEAIQAAMALESTAPELIRQAVMSAGAERSRLLDLPRQVRASVLKILEDARRQGLSETELVEQIRAQVPAGRWSTVEMRAKIMARTETRVGQNLTTAEYARREGIGRLLVFDARLGPTDAECEARAGWVVTPEEARALTGIEHPQGTLSFAPLSTAILQQMGVAV